jgi:2-haloacid dehalogenase
MLAGRRLSMPSERFKPVLAFDVYGTLIDPLRMEEHLGSIFGDRAREAAELWRSKQLEYSFRRSLMKRYRNFDECTAQALLFVCRQMRISLSSAEEEELLKDYLRLPAFPEVSQALESLAARDIEMVAFTNGTEKSARELLEHAGVLKRFRQIVSVDPIRTFKPDPAVYEHLIAKLRSPRESTWVVSSNSFDVIGAKASGLRAAWVQRDPTRAFDPWEFEPDVIVHSLGKLSEIPEFR